MKKDNLFRGGFLVALLFDLFLNVALVICFVLDEYIDWKIATGFLLIILFGLIVNGRFVYRDCIIKERKYPLLRGLVYGLSGRTGSLFYNNDFYLKDNNGYIEHESEIQARKNYVKSNVPLWQTIVAWLVLGSFLFYSILMAWNRTEDSFNKAVAVLLIVYFTVYTIFYNISLRKGKPNLLNKKMGPWAGILALLLFGLAMWFIFYYAKNYIGIPNY